MLSNSGSLAFGELLIEAANATEVDVVVAAIVGIAGTFTYAAVSRESAFVWQTKRHWSWPVSS